MRNAHADLRVGDAAPDVEFATYDGKRVRLSDYKGKYVLVWATWCGPCIAAMPTLQRVQDRSGGDARFALVCVSIDDRIDAPTRFIAARKPPGLHLYAGRASGSTARQDLGVGGIPSVWLIGPD